LCVITLRIWLTAAAFIAARQFFSAFLQFFSAPFFCLSFLAEMLGIPAVSIGHDLPLFCRPTGKTGPLTI
jgi:hypothetical protein